LKLSSPLILKLVRRLVACTSTNSSEGTGLEYRYASVLRGHPQAFQQLLLSCALLPTCPQLLPALVGEEAGQLLVLREGCHHLIVECLLL
jgi:hypothetical protein